MKLIFKFSTPAKLLVFVFAVLFRISLTYSQCGFQATCPNTDYLNFGMGSNSDRNTIEYDNFCSSYHSTVVRTANGTYKTWGEGLANNGIANVLAPIEINSTNYPALTGQILKAHLASIRSGTAQGIVLTTTGLFAWGVEGTIIHQNITTSNTFQKITVGGNAQGLPAGVAPTDVKMIFTTYKTMVITTCSGDVWVLTHQGENTGTGLTGALSAANAVLWYKVTTSVAGNPPLANVVAVRGNQNTMFALTTSGELYTWGTETYLGNNSAIGSRNRATLMTNPNGNSIKMIGVTRDQSNLKPTYYVLNTDGNLYSVGGNNFSQIGDWSTTDRLGWVQPRYTSLTGPVMNNIRWVSPNEHDHAFAAVNVLTADSTNYNWGESNGLMLGRAAAGAANPAIPDGITAANKILAVETGGHTSMLVKKCEDYFGYVGHRINGSMGDGNANSTNEPSYTFATAVVFICGATNLDVSITGAPTFGAGGLYCNGSSVDLIPSPTGGVLTLLSGPATLNGTIMNFNGTGNTTINVQYAVTVPGCPISKTTTIALQTEDCLPIGVTLTGTTTIAENAAGVATLTATLSGAASSPTTVTLTYSGTATGVDYSSSSVTITIPAGSTTGTVTIDPTDDVIFEGNETVIADITNVTGGDGATETGTQTATVTITDNETTPTVTLTGTTSIAENAAGVATLTATLSVATTTSTTVTLTYTGTASGTDYTASSTTITIPAGSTTGTVTIDPTDDVIFEGNETVIADITNVTGGNGVTESGTQTATVTIIDLNIPPTANDNSTTTNEDTPVVLTSIQSNDTDSDGNVVTSTIDLDPTTPGQQTTLTTSNGIWTLNTSTGDISFTPSTNFNGTATITYTIQDNGGLTSNEANLTVTVIAVNDAPNAVDDVASTNEDTPVVIDVTNNDTDTDGAINDASVTIVTNPTNGTVTVNPTTGEVTYTPNPGFNGSDSFTYSVCDNGTPLPAQCDQATVNVTVNAVNDAPNAADDVASTNEDTPVVIDVTNNDTDTDGSIDDASVTIVTNPTNGTLAVNPTTGEVTYTPNAGFNGSDSFTYSVCDNGTPLPAQCDQATVTITVNAVNDAPNAVDDVASTNEDTPVVIDVTNNDTDTDGAINDASVTIVTNPTNGTVTVNPTTGEVTYTPNPGFNGSDSFTYSVCDNGTPLPAQCDQATVNVTVNAVNDAPNAADDVASTNEDTPVVIDVTNNDTDTDGSINDASVTIVTNPTNGTVTVNPTTGEVTYTPNAGFNGSDSFTYSVCDNGTPLPAQCDQATVTITVNAVNDAPNAVDDVASTNEDTPVVIDVTNNDTDTDGSIDDASVTIVTNPTNGTVTVNPTTGEVTYTPNPGFNGSDSFTYSVCDNGTPLPAQCDQAIVTVTVNAVNDPPVVDNDSNTIAEDGGSATGDLTDSGDSDPDGTTLTVNTTPVDGPNNGTITINADGTYSYTPNAGFNGQDTIIVSVCDNGLPLPVICVNDTLIITVTPVNDGPNATIDIATTTENNSVVISILTNDTDSDGNIDSTSVTLIDSPSNGTATVDPITGAITYTPNTGFTGTDTLIYQVCDDGTPLPEICDTALVIITVLSCQSDLIADCDGDGVTNGDEVDPDGDGIAGPNGTDPSDPCSFDVTNQDLGSVSQAWLDADCDGDGASNGEEVDPDGDGIAGPNGTNPSDPCSFNTADQDLALVSQAWLDADCDGDGASNGEEVDPDGDGIAGPNGTNPSDPCSFDVTNQDLGSVSQAWLDADCDGDGVTNGDEVDPDGDGIAGPNGTNPSDPCSFDVTNQDLGSVSQAWLDADCDGDGVTNGQEVIDGTDPNNPCSLVVASQTETPSQAWLDADCDGDGLTNGVEVSGGSNPFDPCDPNPCDSDITIPQAFTPDGDNTNDTFVIPGIENYPKNKLTIYNRWGNEVFFAEGYNNTWNGTANRGIVIGDAQLPTGTYYYILDLNGDGETIYKGYVYLKR
jgi:gliding motility-associated-like protein